MKPIARRKFIVGKEGLGVLRQHGVILPQPAFGLGIGNKVRLARAC